MNNKGQTAAGAGVLIVIVALLGLIVCVWGFDYVPAGSIGVLDRLGEVNPTPMQPSVRWTGMLTNTEKFSTRIQLRQYEASAASNDLQTVSTKVSLNFKLAPEKAPEIYKTLGKEYQDTIITPIVQEAVKASTAKFTAEQLVKTRAEAKKLITDTKAWTLRNGYTSKQDIQSNIRTAQMMLTAILTGRRPTKYETKVQNENWQKREQKEEIEIPEEEEQQEDDPQCW